MTFSDSRFGPLKFFVLTLPLLGFLLLFTVARPNPASATGMLSYYFPNYKNAGDYQSSIVIGNMGSGSTDVEISVGGTIQQTATVAANESIEWSGAGNVYGLVQVKSLGGEPLVVTERVLYKQSFSEVYATQNPGTNLYLSWYDYASPGAQSMIEIANPGVGSADVDVYVAGAYKGSYSIAAGGTAEASFPRLMDGPVKVTSTNRTPVVASMWTIWRNSFNQSMGVPTDSLSDDYYFPNYDQSSLSGQSEWIFMVNPNPSSSIYYEISMGGNLLGAGSISAGNTSSTTFPGNSGGPVEVRAWTDSSKTTPAIVFTTERLVTSNMDFEEFTGTPASTLSNTYYLSRFDNHSPGPVSQLKVANTSNQAADVSVYLGTDTAPAATLSLAAHSAGTPPVSTTPPFEKGPVRIVSQGGQVIIAGEDYTVKTPTNHYFTWYDTTFGYTWLLMAQPQGTGSGSYDMYKQETPFDINNQDQVVADGSTVPRIFYNQLGGPVRVSTDNPSGLVSERSLYNDRSFEEIWSTPYDDLDSRYYWPLSMYDPGNVTMWVLVANPKQNNEDVDVNLSYLAFSTNNNPPTPVQLPTTTISAGSSWTPSLGSNGEYVQVKAYRHGGSPDNPADARKVIASERLLFNGSFNEMPGIAASTLKDTYMWPWFDDENSIDWINVGNPNTNQLIYAGIWVGNSFKGTFQVPPGLTNLWPNPYSAPPIMDGPVEVQGCFVPFDISGLCSGPAPIFASQTVFFGPSYEETAGTSLDDLKPTSNWTWYDEITPDSTNWVLVSNPNQTTGIYYEISIAGSLDPTNPSDRYYASSHGYLRPRQRVTPQFPGIMAGPVQVKGCYVPFAADGSCSSPAPVLASQRVVWNGYFNEVVGKGMSRGKS